MKIHYQDNVLLRIISRRSILNENKANIAKGYKNCSCIGLKYPSQYKQPTKFAPVGSKEP